MKAQTSTQPIKQPSQNEDDTSILADTSFTNASQRGSLVCPKNGFEDPNRFSIPSTFLKNNTMNYIIETPKSLINEQPQQQLNNFFDAASNASFVFEQSTTQRQHEDEQKAKIANGPIRISNFKDLLRLFRINLADDEQTFELNGQKYIIDFEEYDSEGSPNYKIYNNGTEEFNPQHKKKISPITHQTMGDKTPGDDFDNLIDESPSHKGVQPLELLVIPTQMSLPNHVEQKEVEVQVTETDFIDHDFDEEDQRISIESYLPRHISSSPEQQKKLTSKNKQNSQQVVFKNSLFESVNITHTNSLKQELGGQNQFRRHQTIGDTKKLVKQNVNMFELNQIESEKKMLEERLKETQKQLKHLNSMYIHQDNVEDAQLHLGFLFASPLVVKKAGPGRQEIVKPSQQLEFRKEFKEIHDSIKETNRTIRIRKTQATVENLTQMLSQQPLALHFSGHGIQNTPEELGNQYAFKKNEGNFLLFETEDGEGELVSQTKLHQFVEQSKTNFEFVFVASCTSEPVGRIFLNAGAKHVICVKNGENILDGAVITFSKTFYSLVFNQRHTICDAYQMARSQVEQKYNLVEANKFRLLIKEKDMPLNYLTNIRPRPGMPQLDPEFLLDDDLCGLGLEEEHKCRFFGPLKEGDLEYYNEKPRFNEIPAQVDNYIGRQIEIQEIIRRVHQNRLVNVIGLPGIGKTSLVKNAVRYMAERKLFKTGIIFISAKGLITCELFLKQLITYIKDNFELEEEKRKNIAQANVQEFITISLTFLKNLTEKLLVVFDNVEDLLYNDKLAFRNLITDLLDKCPLLTILMTSRTTLGALQDVEEKIFVLQELNVKQTVELFISRSRDIPKQEIDELLQVVPQSGLISEQKQITNINEHHFFKLLGGNPHAIVLAAPILIKMQLKDLYLLLNSKEMHDVLKVDGITDSTVASLRLSLEASLKILEREDKECLRFFFLIGMLPGGVYEVDLENMWKNDWKQHVETLLNRSLLQKKEQVTESETMYTLPPFMSNYAEAKISDEDKILFQNMICKYYAKVCKDIFLVNGKSYKKQNNRQSVLNHQLMEKLLKHETNIWACVNRLVDGQVSLEKEEYQEEEELNSQRLQRFSNLIDKERSFARAFTVKFDKAPEVEQQQQEEEKARPARVESQFKSRNLLKSPIKGAHGESLEQINENAEEQSSDSSDDADDIEGVSNKMFGKDGQSKKKLEDILRNSVINFSRPSTTRIKLSTMKNSEIGKKTLFKTTTIQESETLKKPSLRKESTQRVEELHSLEKLILYYAMNLLLLNETDSCEHLIAKYGLKIKGCQMYEANLKRIQGLIWSKKKEKGEETVAFFEDALKLYELNDCCYGQAVCHFSLGYFYKGKVADFIVQEGKDEDSMLLKSQHHLEKSLHYYKLLNHLIGQALCHKQLLLVANKLHDKNLIKKHAFPSKDMSKYIGNYKNSPYVLRVHGSEMSLMFEVIINNSNSDLFAKVRLINSSSSFDSKISNKLSVDMPALVSLQSTPVETDFNNLSPPGVQHSKTQSEIDKGGAQGLEEEELKIEDQEHPASKSQKKKDGLFKIASLEVVEEENEAPILPINSTPVKEASSDKITAVMGKDMQFTQFAGISRNMKPFAVSQSQQPSKLQHSPSIFEDALDMEQVHKSMTPRDQDKQKQELKFKK